MSPRGFGVVNFWGQHFLGSRDKILGSQFFCNNNFLCAHNFFSVSHFFVTFLSILRSERYDSLVGGVKKSPKSENSKIQKKRVTLCVILCTPNLNMEFPSFYKSVKKCQKVAQQKMTKKHKNHEKNEKLIKKVTKKWKFDNFSGKIWVLGVKMVKNGVQRPRKRDLCRGPGEEGPKKEISIWHLFGKTQNAKVMNKQ